MRSSDDPGSLPGTTVWQLGAWHVEPALNELRRRSEVQRIERKAMEVLVALARRAGKVVSRDELFAAVWPAVVVGDDAVSQAVLKLRKALRDNAKPPRYIETIPKRGYRLVAAATPLELTRDA